MANQRTHIGTLKSMPKDLNNLQVIITRYTAPREVTQLLSFFVKLTPQYINTRLQCRKISPPLAVDTSKRTLMFTGKSDICLYLNTDTRAVSISHGNDLGDCTISIVEPTFIPLLDDTLLVANLKRSGLARFFS